MRSIFSAVATLLVLSSASWAGAMQEPKVDYTADSHMEVEGMNMDGKVFYSPGKERREMTVMGSPMTTIVRQDKKVMWQLSSQTSTYQEIPLEQGGEMTKDVDEKVGEETIDGHQTTKYKLIMTGQDGNKFGGFIWLTKEGIPLKIDAISKSKNSRAKIKMEFKNVKIGKQDPKLFELPQGYAKQSMPMNPFAGGGGGLDLQELMKNR